MSDSENNKGKKLRVIDHSATELNPVRVHDVLINGNIFPVTFKYNEATILPFEQGVKFMKDGFTVTEVDGDEVNMPAVPNDSVAVQLGADECVAKYRELNLSSLKLRAAQRADGEAFLDAGEEDKDAIVAFLSGDQSHYENLILDVGSPCSRFGHLNWGYPP